MARITWDMQNFRRAALCSLVSLIILCLLPTNLSKQIRSTVSFLHKPWGYLADDDYFKLAPDAGTPSFAETLFNFLFVNTDWLRNSTDALLNLRAAMLASWFGLALLVNCGLIILLSTYYLTKILDIGTPLEFHWVYAHRHNRREDNDENRYREREYRNRMDSSLRARNLLEIFWALRIVTCCFILLTTGPSGQLACLLHHMLNLAFATILRRITVEDQTEAACLFYVSTYLPLAFMSVGYIFAVPIYIVHLLVRFLGTDFLSTIWMNDLPCIHCDEVKPDIRSTKISQSTSTLGRFNEEMCRHCWGPWSAGDIVVILRCGHVYHENCCDEWFRNSGRRQCPMCHFEVCGTDYRRVSHRRTIWTSEQVQRRYEELNPYRR